MLSSNTQITPRPRPPAKLRRSSSHTRPDWQARSPPPYAPFAPDTLPTLLGSPIGATSQLIRLEDVCENDEQIQEKSKEELEELLRRASSIIKERERELDLTSETCKAFAENNALLKSRNDALIARLPSSQPSSPLLSPSLLTGSFLSPSLSRNSSRSLILSPNQLTSPSLARRRLGQARRISSTPAELAALADQNAELLAKLADLEAEASRAEEAGKRRLRNLEAEIEGLRDELDRAREESMRLEETPEQALPPGIDKQVVKMFKRLSREAKVRELKAKTRPWEQSEKLEEPKNFAPDNLSPGLPFTSRIVSRKTSTPILSVETSVRNTSVNSSIEPELPHMDSPLSLSTITPSTTSSGSTNAREQALVSQLLLKIRELEETNEQLADNHLKASMRLREAQTESESVRRLCEFISDEVEGELDMELEVVDDAVDEDEEQEDARVGDEAHDNNPGELRKTVRLRSVGRKNSFDLGTGSTVHSVRLRKFKSVDSLPRLEPSSSEVVSGNMGDRRPKMRKTVLGLFEEGSSVGSPPLDTTLSLRSAYTSPNQPTITHLPSVNEPYEDSVTQVDSDTEGNKMISLGSELGLELDGVHPPPLHVRSKSIMELLHSIEAASPVSATAPSSSTLQPPTSSLHPETLGRVSRRKEGGPGEGRSMDECILYPRLRRARSSATFSSSSSSAQHTRTRKKSDNSSLFLSSDKRSESESNPGPKTQFDKLRALVLELWLWMYFAAVVAVFIFSMARKGPKVVLKNKVPSAAASAKRS